MTTAVFLTVLLAALIHAGWNAAVKASDDKLRFMVGLVLGHAPFAGIALLFVPPPAWSSAPYIIGGAALHFGYQLFLQHSYRHGDLTHVYPMARGSAPLLVAILSTWWLDEQLGVIGWVGISIIAIGLISLAFVRHADGIWHGRTATMAVVTGAFIAGYTIVDGAGARIAGTAIGFYAMLSLANALLMAIFAAWRHPGLLTVIAGGSWHRPLLAGGASFTAFALVVWAFTQAPIALVAALRETSVIFALLIGVVFLRERLNLLKLFAVAATSSGILLIRLTR